MCKVMCVKFVEELLFIQVPTEFSSTWCFPSWDNPPLETICGESKIDSRVEYSLFTVRNQLIYYNFMVFKYLTFSYSNI